MNVEIANRLAALRRQNNLSQEELADKLGISRQAVSKWEQAKSSPDTDNLIRLARLYNVSLDELLQMEGDLPPREAYVDENENDDEQAASGSAGGHVHYTDSRADWDAYSDEYKQRKQAYRFWVTFPYPVLMVIVFLVLGFFCRLWHPGWLVFLTIPIYYWLVNAFKPRR